MINQPVQIIDLPSRQVEIYDQQSEYVNPSEPYFGDRLKTAQTFHIPSSRYYYLTLNGDKVPYLALTDDPNQFDQDLEYWINPNIHPSYLPPAQPSESPESDLFHLLNGVRVEPINITRNYENQIFEIIAAYRNQSMWPENYPEYKRNKYNIYVDWINELIIHPISPGTNFLTALKIANDNVPNQIQDYLDSLGIITFTAEDIVNEPLPDRVFYLTRFYGRPKQRDQLKLELQTKKLVLSAQTLSAKRLAEVAVNSPKEYLEHKKGFDYIFNEFNKNNISKIWEKLGANSRKAFFDHPLDYISLLSRSSNLPRLTYNTINHLRNRDQNSLHEMLKNYSDVEISQLVGPFESDFIRPQIITAAIDRLFEYKAILLTPDEEGICSNPETGLGEAFSQLHIVYIGIGSIMEGVDCYSVEELVESFASNTSDDGVIIFRDPNDYQKIFTIDEIKMIRDAFKLGRPGIPKSQELIDLFNQYVDRYELQESENFMEIRKLREFAKDEQNENLLHRLFHIYFEIGMYMRQWKGPGHPYPLLERETGVGPEQGLSAEVAIQMNITIGDLQKELEDIMSQFPEDIQDGIWNLQVKDKRDQIENYGYTIENLYGQVNTGEFCIRMASRPWAVTGAYYLKQILNKDIPNFDLTQQIDFIY